MSTVPDELKPDTDSLNEDTRIAGAITHKDAISRQNDRIAYLRTLKKEWDEAVMALRDMCVGLEDDEFFDGIPPNDRKRRDEYKANSKPLLAEAIEDKWAPYGWRRMPMYAKPGPDGPIYVPAPHQLSRAYRIILRLLNRQGLLWKTRKKSRLTPKKDESDVIDMD